MLEALHNIPYSTLALIALAIGLAPFYPEPHLIQKIRMLKAGTLKRPLDIFDLIMHATPFLLLIIKFGTENL